MEFLNSIITITATGTLLWLCLFCIRPITQKLFSQTWHYYASLIPLFFLLGGSSFIAPIVLTVYTAMLRGDINTIVAKDFGQVTVAEQAAGGISFLNVFVNGVAGKQNLNIATPYILILWVIGLLVFFVLKLNNYYKFKSKILKLSVATDIKQCPIKVIKSPLVTTPMLVGIWKPFIVLPDFELSKKELDIVLSHELIHQKRGDLIIKLIVLITNGIHWFNPIIYYLNKDIDFLCEQSCDEKLVLNLDKESRRFYGETIISMLEHGIAQKSGLYTKFCGSEKNIKRRLLNMMNFKKTKMSLTTLSLVFAIIFTGFGGTMAFAMSNVIKSTNTVWYETYKPIIAAEKIYVNDELIDGFPAFFTRSIQIGGIFEENIYIPLKASAEKLELKVTWDKNTNTTTVGGITVKQGENPDGYNGSVPQIFGGYLYISPSFFTEVLGKDLKLTYEGVVRHETVQIGFQVYDVDLEENLETGSKWECFINEETGVILVRDEYLDSGTSAADKKAIHRFTFKFPRDMKAGEEVFTFEETIGDKKTGNKIIYTNIQPITEPIAKP